MPKLFQTHNILSFLLCLMLLNTFTAAQAQDNNIECQPLATDQHTHSLGKKLHYIRDNQDELSIQDVISAPLEWQQSNETTPNFGFDHAAYWLNFKLCGEIMNEGELLLQLAYPMIDSIDLYVVSQQQIIHREHAGDLLAFGERTIPHRMFLFILLTNNLPEMQVFMRIKTTSSVQLPLTLYTPRGFFIADQKANLLQGLYFGIIIAMIFYNAFLYYSLRDKPYLFYVLYLTSYMGFQATLQGFAQQFFFDSVWIQNNAITFFGFLSIFLSFRFAISFLNLYDNNPKVSLWLKNLSYVALISIPLIVILPYVIVVKFMLVMAIVGSLLLLYSGLTLWGEGDSAARIYAIAWCTILVAFMLASLNKMGLIPRVFFTEEIMQFGELIQVMLLAIALGQRINYERRKRAIAQQNLLAMQQNLTATLEKKVEGRTKELNQTLTQLEQANAELDKISRIDGLTKVGNRRFFDDEFKREYLSSIRQTLPLAVILIDIDHFKMLNDQHGHQVGDLVLQDMAQMISLVAKRPGDKVFRYGGEEFVVLLSNTDDEGARLIAEEIRSNAENLTLKLDGLHVSATISAGISVLDAWDDPISREKLLKQADLAMYRAKENGRNQIQSNLY